MKWIMVLFATILIRLSFTCLILGKLVKIVQT